MTVQGLRFLVSQLHARLKERNLWFSLTAATLLVGSLLIYSGNQTTTNDCRVAHVLSTAAGSTLDKFPARPAQNVETPCSENIKKSLFLFEVSQKATSSQENTFTFGEGLFYYYVPVVAKELGLYKPLLALALFSAALTWVVCFFVFSIAIKNESLLVLWAYLVCCYARLGNHNALVTVYYQHYLMPLIIAGIGWLSLKLIEADELSQHFKGIALRRLMGIIVLSIVAGFSILLRTSAILPFYLGLGTILFLSWFVVEKKKRHLRRAFAVLGIIFCTTSGIGWTFSSPRIATNTEWTKLDQPDGHVFWHTLWCSLGLMKDKRYPFQWWDGSTEIYVRSTGSSAPAYGKEYEIILRRYIIDLLRKDPGFFWRFLKFQFSADIGPFLFGLFVFFLVLLSSKRFTGCRVLSVFLLVGTLGTRPLQLISQMADYYYYQVRVGEYLSYYVLCIWVLHAIKKASPSIGVRNLRNLRATRTQLG